MNQVSETERADLARIGVSVPTGVMVKSARWGFQYGARDELIDLLARDWFVGKVALLPADVTPFSGDLAARLCRSVARTAVARATKLATDWEAYADLLTARANVVAPMVNRPTLAETMVPATERQIMFASSNPMGYARWSMALEHEGSGLLRAMNLPATRPDVWNAAKRTHVARPDSVAYRGQTRFARPTPCRYGKSGHQAAVEYVEANVWAVTGDAEISARADTWSHAELLTMLTRNRTARYPVAIEARDDIGKLISRRTEYCSVKLPDNGLRRGFRGHRAIEWATAPRVSRKRSTARVAARAARSAVGATSARGRSVGPWSIAERSLPRAIAARDLTATVTAIETMIRMATDHMVTFPNGTVVTISGPSQVVTATGRAYPVREYSRRAALAGMTA